MSGLGSVIISPGGMGRCTTSEATCCTTRQESPNSSRAVVAEPMHISPDVLGFRVFRFRGLEFRV